VYSFRVPSLWDWLEVFRRSIPQFQTLAAKDPDVPAAERQVGYVIVSTIACSQ
jgi:hypothetical protein